MGDLKKESKRDVIRFVVRRLEVYLGISGAVKVTFPVTHEIGSVTDSES